MPQLDLVGWMVWIVVAGAQFALFLTMVYTHAWKRWPSIFAFSYFKSSVSALLISCMLIYTDRSAAVYFYAFWSASAIAGVLEVWMILSMACAVVSGYPTLCRLLQTLIPTLALLYLGASLLIVDEVSVPFVLRVSRVVVSLDRAATLAWLATFLCLVYASDFLGIQWRKPHRQIALGFTLIVVTDAVVSWLLGICRDTALLSNLQGAIYALSLAIWIRAFLVKEPAEKLPSIERIQAIGSVYRSTVSKSRYK